MKHLLYIIAVLALVSACSNDDDLTPNGRDGKNLTTFRACTPTTGDDDAKTRTVLDDSLNILWRDSDWISVIGANGTGECANHPCFIASGAGTTNATFQGSAPAQTDGYIATYPCNDDNTVDYDADGTYKVHYVWNGATQAVDTNSFDPTKALMYARINDADEAFQFKNVCAYIKFRVNYKCQSVVITSADGTPLTCKKMTVGVDAEGKPAITATEGDTCAVIVTGANGGELVAGKDYYVAVLPGSLASGFSMKFTSAVKASKTYTKSTTKAATLKRNTVLNLGNINIEGNIFVLLGSGTADDPYQIADTKDMYYTAKWIDNNVSGYPSASYQLTADIDYGGQAVYPIGGSESSGDKDYYFSGTFEGNGHTISNYKAGQATNDFSGLFGLVENATIKNLNVSCVGVNFCNVEDGKIHAFSPLVAYASGATTIQNCHVSTSLDSIKVRMCDFQLFYGNILGYGNGSNINITRCSSSANVYINHVVDTKNKQVYVGGLVGGMMSSSGCRRLNMTRCRNTGNVTVENKVSACAGGILGMAFDASDAGDVICYLMNCVNSGKVSINPSGQSGSGSSGYAGGILGGNNSDGRVFVDDPKIFNCLNTGNIYCCQDKVYAGGIMGLCYDGDTDVYNCASTGSISAKSGSSQQIGALCGNDEGTYKYCYWTTGLKITYNGDTSDSSNCSQLSDITSGIMNAHLSACTGETSDFAYYSWIGSSSAGTLNISI